MQWLNMHASSYEPTIFLIRKIAGFNTYTIDERYKRECFLSIIFTFYFYFSTYLKFDNLKAIPTMYQYVIWNDNKLELVETP